jgi:hypothetical protein
MRFNRLTQYLQNDQEKKMKANQDLIGKTITGVVAVNQADEDVREIWMLQFSDGSHVEFVSPMARRRLRRGSRLRNVAISGPPNELQLALNVA